MNIARVIVDLSLDRYFDYIIPEELIAEIKPGSQVLVPFGHSRRLGFVTALVETPDTANKLKQIAALPPNKTSIPEKLLRLSEWMAHYYCTSMECAVKTLLPGAVRKASIKEKMIKVFSLAEPQPEKALKTEKQRRVIQFLKDEKSAALKMIMTMTGCGASVVTRLVADGFLAVSEERSFRNPFTEEVMPDQPLPPTGEQQAALNQFDRMLSGEEKRRVMLLFGATNSGKTEVYLQAIAKVIAQGKAAIVLVPEIALTPQTVRRFRARFGDEVSVMHSRLSEAERFDQWTRMRRGEVKIAIGARSALFAPFDNLGLIIVDEEHEGSYKQSESPRYNARDVAVVRGKMENAIVILGSATPSIESFYNAESGKYLLCEMKSTAGSAVPPVMTVVDLRMGAEEYAGNSEKKEDGDPAGPHSKLFSTMLVNAIHERLAAREQTILFRNMRGFSREMRCEACGFVPGCPDCSVSYAYHRREGVLICHMCGNTMPAPERCPQCGAEGIRYPGSGTEKIEAMAHLLFPNARIGRMDSDSMRGVDAHETMLNRMQRGEIDILIGTQMIAKGIHIPNITLVGVINADQGLYIEDFRAAERTFQLLTQVAGRAGRGDLPGEVIIQTFSPGNDAITLALKNDYLGFYQYDTAVRQLLNYPPFGHMIILHIRSEDEAVCRECALYCRHELESVLNDSVIVTDPLPSPVERIKGKFRYQIVIRGERLKRLREKLRSLALTRYPGAEIYVDADPQNLM